MSYLLAFLGFAALIVLHEFGHFLAAKAVGMRVERFSLFFGPPLVKTRRGETEYGIGPIPLGGYVRITGMNPNEKLGEEAKLREKGEQLERLHTDIEATSARDPADAEELRREERRLAVSISAVQGRLAAIRRRAYYNQPVWKRVVVILAGPAMNLLIAFALLLGIFWSQGLVVLRHGQPVASHTVEAGSLVYPASRYLKAGDRIVAVDGKRGLSVDQITQEIASHRCVGQLTAGCEGRSPVKLLVERGGKLLSFSITPRYDPSAKRMRIGFAFGEVVRAIGPITAAGQSVSQMWYVTHVTVSTVVRIFEPKVRRQLHGIVGGFKVTQQRFALDTTDALYTLALISLSLAVINLFPFLPLDGGHVFWAVAEKVRGKRIPFEVMERAGAVGFVLIIIVFVIGLSNDISTLAGPGFNVR